MEQYIRDMMKERTGLIYYDSFQQAKTAFEDAIKICLKWEIKIKANHMNLVITFPNGNKLIFGHGEYEKYLGNNGFLFVVNKPELEFMVRL